MTPDLISTITGACAIGFVTFIWWRIKTNLNEFKVELAAMKKDISRQLYRDDGTTIYMPHAECERMQGQCRLALCTKIDKLEAALASMDAKRESARSEQNAQTAELLRFVGRMEKFMEMYNK